MASGAEGFAMHTSNIGPWCHVHSFLDPDHARNERRTWWVVALTAVMMAGEIVAGTVFNSMSLLADGWHMATHAGALAISGFAYVYARRHAGDARYTFGTGKVGDLAAYTSALILLGVAFVIAWDSAARLTNPVPIAFSEAIAVAVLGLGVNVVSAALLARNEGHEHTHGHEHAHIHEKEHAHAGHGHDRNLRAAYMHVLADALTSVLAIVALACGVLFGWAWLDPVMGLVGAGLILYWAVGLIRDSGHTLLDADPNPALAKRIVRAVEENSSDRIADLHIWRVGPGRFAAIVSVVTDRPVTAEHYKNMLAGHDGLVHLTVEVQRCREA